MAMTSEHSRVRIRKLASRHHGAFGHDRFGRTAERLARFFGTPGYIIGQTVVVAVWIVLNVIAVSAHWDPYPFILLNLAFSTQAAYAAPLILLAQTRQADRDHAQEELAAAHRDAIEEALAEAVDEIRAIVHRDAGENPLR
jgi:uncharacterized membrane protein